MGASVDTNTSYLLKLFVAGDSSRTGLAVANLRHICEDEFPGCYELVIIDVLRHPGIAEENKILAAPTLIKERPLPVRRIIGDLSDKEKVLTGIGLLPPQR
ncbi:MAG: circadian clock KaiB family protein [Rhodocyclaceae bacterium]|nr:circadian clock KaiB family protein [Rhodocyclaceae bacterium]MDZ4216001.1 circadian clock KaiB family protein [Rhodocyclaceae bacterium]